tara:strand:- start:294 stop:443 length:150 start_codon:yes stop_codon:yes gene_type:complete
MYLDAIELWQLPLCTEDDGCSLATYKDIGARKRNMQKFIHVFFKKKKNE